MQNYNYFGKQQNKRHNSLQARFSFNPDEAFKRVECNVQTTRLWLTFTMKVSLILRRCRLLASKPLPSRAGGRRYGLRREDVGASPVRRLLTCQPCDNLDNLKKGCNPFVHRCFVNLTTFFLKITTVIII